MKTPRAKHTYRSARRNWHFTDLNRLVRWDETVAANNRAKLKERRDVVELGRTAVALALAENDVLIKGLRHDMVMLTALRAHWASVTGLGHRLVRRMVRQLDLDLRSARA